MRSFFAGTRLLRMLSTSAMVLLVSSGCMLREAREQQANAQREVIADRSGFGAPTSSRLTAIGDVVALSDSRFNERNAAVGLWRPYDFIVSSHPGIYFLQPYDPEKLPVLFVHGINGTPANFSFLIEHLDRSRFQAWVYSYPSGMPLSVSADHLNRTMTAIESKFRLRRFVVVAHSMGGLIARGFLLKHGAESAVHVPLFITISTPWDGHAAARIGVRYSPIVLPVWRDLVPGSEYLRSIFAIQLPSQTEQDLIFTFARSDKSYGSSDDRVVTVASQLAVPAQREATHIYGMDDSHRSVLQDENAAALINKLLAAKWPVLHTAAMSMPRTASLDTP